MRGMPALLAALRAAVVDAPGAAPVEVRRAAASGTEVPELWAGYVATVRDASYRVDDAAIAALEAAGHPPEAIFEVTVAAATGAALHRLESGLRALGREA